MSSLWAVKFMYHNRAEGLHGHLIYGANCLPYLFRTKRAAKAFIDAEYRYIRRRRDLMAEPHGWRMPIPVRVEIKEVKK